MAVGTSDGEYYPSHLEHVLASLDTSGSTKEPLAPRNAPIDELRNGNEDPASRPAPTDIRSDVKVAQAGPNNKDTTPVPDNRPDLYEDENGLQRSRKNDSVLEQFNPFVDKMAKGLSQSDVDLIDKYHGFESTHGKWTDEDQKRIQPLLDAVDGQVKHLGNTESKFTPSGQEIIEFKNWDSLLFDKIMKHYKTINPGKRSEADLPENAKPTAAEFTPDSTWAAMVDSFTNPDSKVPSAEKMVQGNYSKVVDWLTENGKTPGQEMQNWSTKEKLGYMLSTAMGLVGAGKSGVPTRGVLSGKSGVRDVSDIHQSGKGSAVNDNYPDTAEFSNLRMSASEMKEYLADRAERPLTNDMTKAEVDKMISTWEGANTPPSAYERALANQKAGRMNPAGDTADEFIQSLRKGEKPNLEVVTQEPGWSKHSDKVHNLTDAQGRDIGSAVYREHNDSWVGSRFNPKNNQIIDRKTFRTQQEAKSYAEGNNNLNPQQEPQAGHRPSQEQIDAQRNQQREAKVNVGQGKGVLNDNIHLVGAMVAKGMKPSEIAARFDVTPLAVRNWIKRKGGINNIDDILKKRYQDEDN